MMVAVAAAAAAQTPVIPTGPSHAGWQEIRIAIALAVIATLAMILRFVARFMRKARLQPDDWLAITSWVFIIAMLVELILWATIGGSGYHFATLEAAGDTARVETFFKVFMANEFTYGITSPLVKLTVLFLYRGLFPVRKFERVADVLSVLCCVWGAMTVIVVGVQCRPLAAYWDSRIPGHCINQIAFITGIQGINVFLDLTILVLPQPMVWSLHRSWKEKLALSGVFMLGGFVVAASIYRLVAITQISQKDITYTIIDGAIWTFVEPCIGLVCACLPIIRGLFRPSVRSAVTKRNAHYGYGGPSSGRTIVVVGGTSKDPSHVQRHYIEMDSRNGSSQEFVQTTNTD